jgi:hypothetical protein
VPSLPRSWPPAPAAVDPDARLPLVAGRRYRRYVRPVLGGGTVAVERHRYHVGKALTGQRMAVAVAAAERALVVRQGQTVVKRLPLRGPF